MVLIRCNRWNFISDIVTPWVAIINEESFMSFFEIIFKHLTSLSGNNIIIISTFSYLIIFIFCIRSTNIGSVWAGSCKVNIRSHLSESDSHQDLWSLATSWTVIMRTLLHHFTASILLTLTLLLLKYNHFTFVMLGSAVSTRLNCRIITTNHHQRIISIQIFH